MGLESTITAVGVILAALITGSFGVQIAIITNTKKYAKTAANQTENDHVRNPKKISNLRDNIDVNHERIMEKLDAVMDQQRRQGNKIDRLFSITNKQRDDINEITGSHALPNNR